MRELCDDTFPVIGSVGTDGKSQRKCSAGAVGRGETGNNHAYSNCLEAWPACAHISSSEQWLGVCPLLNMFAEPSDSSRDLRWLIVRHGLERKRR